MAKNTKLNSDKKSRANNPKKNTDFFIVGIGGSAGGLSAFIELLKNIPPGNNLAFVIVQHLLADSKSSLSDILADKTKLPVKEVSKDTRVNPGQVYVIPPNKNITLKDGKVQLSPRTRDGLNLPVDKFFTSLANVKKQNAIGVILSGTGSDGTQGMKAIREAGGITFAQDKNADFSGMPDSVVGAGLADYVLDPAKIAEKLLEIAANPSFYYEKNDTNQGRAKPDQEDEKYREILKMILDSSEVDFTCYKPGTLKRRIRRRMDAKNIENISKYAEYLQKNPQEVKNLYQDILIKVTNFFRDEGMFDYLKTDVFPEIFKQKPQALRVWVPGCSTGEEAYSLAISLAEFMEKNKKKVPVQIFGTDISETALDTARHATYPKNIEANIPAKILKKYFIQNKDSYTINPDIRAMCIFARHNIVKDVPFTKMDIVSCRNVLIYLDSELQKKAFPIFHYALKHKGYLILGSAETATSFSDLFSAIDKDQKVYSKRATASTPRLDFPVSHPTLPQAVKTPEVESKNIEEQADKIVLDKHSSPGVIINNDLSIVQFRGDVSSYLSHPSGRANLDLTKMARKALLAKLLEMINKARETEATVTKRHTGLRAEIEVIPLTDQHSQEKFFLILFKETDSRKTPNRDESAGDARVAEAEKELGDTVAQLQSLLETRDATNEELRSANEEVMSANEELQSTNEELETTKEELQSANEELMTLNTELQHRNVDLKKTEESHNRLVPKFKMRGEELNRKDEFISILGHELRNPLAPILHSVELASLQRTKNPEIKRLLEVIERNAKQMKYILNDLLDVARAQRGKIELKPETVNFNDIVNQAVETVRTFADARQHDMKVYLSKKPIYLSLDPLRTTQIIYNLVNNAAKYTPAGGKIIIKVTAEKNYAQLSVQDNGIGISQEMLTKIFDIFSQAVQPLDNNQGGLGVGLMLARNLAELHGGSLTAESAGLGHGSKFTLRLPVNTQKHKSINPAAEDSEPTKKNKPKRRNVVVVDDNIALADLMGKLLHALDQDVAVAYDGASAIDLINTKKPDLIFIDISMPAMDGYELVKTLRKNPDLKKTKIMALSGYGEEFRQKSIKAGFDEHLTKPLGINDLQNILASLDTEK